MTAFERNYTAKAMREIRSILAKGRSEPKEDYCSCSICESEERFIDHGKWSMLWLGIVFALCFIASCAISTPAHAFTDEQAIKTIVGEASNQGLIGMTAVAEVIRHKGSLRGFYGLHAKHSAHEPKWVWIQAKKAWYASKTTNYTLGADHFENLKLDTPYWVKNCVLTFRYKDHAFFKEVSHG